MQTKIMERYFFFGSLMATLIFIFLILRPFWVVFVLGISFSIVLYPIYEWLNNKKLPGWLSAFVTVFLFAIVLCGPLLGIGAIVFNQSQDIYRKVVNEGSAKPLLDSIENKVNGILPGIISVNINEKTKDIVSYISSNIANIFSTTISAFFSFLLVLLIIFYFLKEGAQFKKIIVLWSPLGQEDDERIINKLTQAVNGIIKGTLFIALVQGILMAFGFWLFGIPNGALWGVVAAVTSLIPTFGTALVSIPGIIFLFLAGKTASAFGLLIWATIAVGLIDNFLGPLVVGRKINLPSIFILFSVLGGISFLGPIGVLVGPLSISLLYALMSIYKSELN